MTFPATAAIGAAGAVVAGATTGNEWLTVVVAVLGSSATAGVIGAWNRRRSGEGPAAAARDLTEAAGEMGMLAAREALRLQARIVDLTTQLAETTKLYADSRIEAHGLKSELAALAAQCEAIRLELETERVRSGSAPGRRDDDE